MGKNKVLRKETRDEKARRELINMKERQKGITTAMVNKKKDYIKNLVNGKYYLARGNMIADQITAKDIVEEIDGCKKTEALMYAEYALMKMQGLDGFRNAHFAKKDLIEEYKISEDDVKAIEEDLYNGTIVREEYDESYKKSDKATFVKEVNKKE